MATIANPRTAFEPDVAAFVEKAITDGRPPFETMSVAEARAFYRAARDTVGLLPIGIGEVSEASFAGRNTLIPIRRYMPASIAPGPQPAILFFHGGGWVIGDLDTHDSICRHLVHRSGMQVIAVDYRRAPEHPFPGAVEDAVDAHAMLLDRAESWDIDPKRIAVAGDSAGGCLAVVTALHAREMCRPMPFAQILFYPVADLRGRTQSYLEVQDVPITGRTLAWFRDHYLENEEDASDWRNSPLLARSMNGLPATFISVAGHDPLRDEGMMLAQRLYKSGVFCELRDLPGQIHGYLTLGRLIAEADRSILAAARFLKKHCPASKPG